MPSNHSAHNRRQGVRHVIACTRSKRRGGVSECSIFPGRRAWFTSVDVDLVHVEPRRAETGPIGYGERDGRRRRAKRKCKTSISNLVLTREQWQERSGNVKQGPVRLAPFPRKGRASERGGFAVAVAVAAGSHHLTDEGPNREEAWTRGRGAEWGKMGIAY